ncbi:unnamed protein product [Dovyalis caffra]|uniref:Uncharacterized protein n=1 Tax=Dovyalis caffra TaxID=77055 RepID=A0AAV1R2B0_9ROSI|nr:unnamed protein product [Dovyalis caffra]
MGNEMGNNNTTGLREEDTTAGEAQGKSVQEPVDASVLKEENHVVPTEESKDYHEEVTELDSDDSKSSGVTHDHNHISDETGFSIVEHTEFHPTAKSPKAETKSNEVLGVDNEFQAASFSNELEGHEKPKESNMEGNVLGTNSNQLEKQASFKKEEEEIMSTSPFVTISPSHDPEPQDSVELKFDQHELTENYADQSVQESTNSPKPSENSLGPSVAGITKENGQLLNSCHSDNLDGILVSATNIEVEEKKDDLSETDMASQEDKMLSEDKVEVGNDLSKTIVTNVATIQSDSRSDRREECEEELSRDMVCYGSNCSMSQPGANLIANSLNSHAELSVPEDKCMVLAEETEFRRKESEIEVNKHHYNLNQSSEDSIRESEIDLANASQTDFVLGPSCKNNEESSINVSHDPVSNGSCQFEEEKVAENGSHIDLFNGIQSEASEDSCREFVGDTMIVPKLGMLPEELSMSNRKGNEEETDCKLEEEKPAEEQIVEEVKEKTEAPCTVGNGAEEQRSRQQFVSKSVSVQAEAYIQQAPASPFQFQDPQEERVIASGDAQGKNELNLEFKPESCKEFRAAKAPTDQAACINIAETSTSAVELAKDKPQQEASYYVIAFEQREKPEIAIFPKGDFEAQESVGRLSTESNPDNVNIHIQIRKSPSFDLDLRIDARSEESDQTPLLYQDKITTESSSKQADVRLQSPHLLSQHNEEALRPMAVEEKVITPERSDSEKSRTPFLGFMKEDDEAHVIVTPKEQDNHAAPEKAAKDLWNSPAKEVASASPKGKEKHRRRTSLFGHCMCCATKRENLNDRR